MLFDPENLAILIAMADFFTLVIQTIQQIMSQSVESLIVVIASLLGTLIGTGA